MVECTFVLDKLDDFPLPLRLGGPVLPFLGVPLCFAGPFPLGLPGDPLFFDGPFLPFGEPLPLPLPGGVLPLSPPLPLPFAPPPCALPNPSEELVDSEAGACYVRVTTENQLKGHGLEALRKTLTSTLVDMGSGGAVVPDGVSTGAETAVPTGSEGTGVSDGVDEVSTGAGTAVPTDSEGLAVGTGVDIVGSGIAGLGMGVCLGLGMYPGRLGVTTFLAGERMIGPAETRSALRLARRAIERRVVLEYRIVD